ncbi:MAG: peptide-methionine (R)-S-oxide reductase [Alphaproteobacteria bacterium]|jgi:peptide-methionine (R)-S-oxide reductase
MNRRDFLASIAIGSLFAISGVRAMADSIKKLLLSDKEWRMKLNDKQYDVLREEVTEPAWSSDLNKEKREGVYACAGCGLALFHSSMKFDSGTGWPSFTTTIKDAVETKTDWKILYPRTEYHCARCGGHQGHVFKDGPAPTGERWCNNGLALKFIPTKEKV